MQLTSAIQAARNAKIEQQGSKMIRISAEALDTLVEAAENQIERTYKIHWLSGETQLIKGRGPTEAFAKSGLGAGAVAAMDYYEKVETDEP